MEDLRVLIADDDEGMRSVMRKIVSRVEGFVLAGQAADGETALALTEKLKPNVVFLDVEMPGMSGVECARAIEDMDPSIIIIFATAHENYRGDAFEVYAFDYLMKPFKVERVIQTLERARDRLMLRGMRPLEPPVSRPRVADGRLMLRHRDGVTFLDLKDILLVQREDRATVLYTLNDGRYVTSDSLSEMEERLHSDAFFRCHKSYIINLNHIRDITPYGRWTYVVRLEGTRQDALITHEKYEELERMFR
ncbi:MAG TPA: response regulator transcription factor [Candidatus Limiplasma stercoravium]|nr:response regulator transcription factor [Candidatus Limiplasma stercoravium]